MPSHDCVASLLAGGCGAAMSLERSEPAKTMSDLTIRQEQDAFEQQLPELLSSHRGEYALMKDGKVVNFFPTHDAAYEAALDQFGLDATFLIAKVDDGRPQPVSIAWETGVMFA